VAHLPVQVNCQLNWPLGALDDAGYLSSLDQNPPVLLHAAQDSLRLTPAGTIEAVPLRARQLFPFLSAALAQLAAALRPPDRDATAASSESGRP